MEPIKNYTTKVNQTNLGLSLGSSSPNDFPIAYSDNVWDIAQNGSNLAELLENTGSFDQHTINETLAATFEESRTSISYAESQNLTNTQRNTALANVSNQSPNNPFDGKMGYLVLKPQVSDDLTSSFAAQIQGKENYIFEIRDVFDLGGTQEIPVSVTIPEGCTLKFNGGLIKNCTIQGNNTVIDASPTKIFDETVTLGGVFNNPEFYSEWFGAKGDGTTDCTTAIQKLDGFPIKFLGGTYIVSNVILHARTMLIGCGIEKTIIKQKDNAVDDLIILQDWYGGCMRDLSVRGNTTATLSGNGFMTALVKLRSEKRDQNNTYNYYSSIDNIFINGAGSVNRFSGLSLLGNNQTDNGFTCASNWVFHISNMWIRHCGAYGIYDASSDNLFNTIDVGSAGYANVYECGSSNMWSNCKLDGDIYTIEGTAEEIYNMEDKGALLIINSGGILKMSGIDLQDCKYCGCKIISCEDSNLGIMTNTIGTQSNISSYAKNFYIKTLTRSLLDLTIKQHTNQVSCIDINSINRVYENNININFSDTVSDSDRFVLNKLTVNNNVLFPVGGPGRAKISAIPITNNVVLSDIIQGTILDDSYYTYNNIIRDSTTKMYEDSSYIVMDNTETQLTRGIISPSYDSGKLKRIRRTGLYAAMMLVRIESIPTSGESYEKYPYINTALNGKVPDISCTRRTRSATPQVGDIYYEVNIFSYAANSNVGTSEYIYPGINLYLHPKSNGKFSIGNFCVYRLDNVNLNDIYSCNIKSAIPTANTPFTTDLMLEFNSPRTNLINIGDSSTRVSISSDANIMDNNTLLFDTTLKKWVFYEDGVWYDTTTGQPLT